MSKIYTPTQDMEFLTPFGPTMGYLKLPDLAVAALNSCLNDKLVDYSDNLVGKVREELKFDNRAEQVALKAVANFVYKYFAFTVSRNTFGEQQADRETNDYSLELISAWFVRQFEGEYNPLHIHPNCQLSCVGYLALPDGIEAEWEEDYKDHHPSHGHIHFASGTAAAYSSTNFLVKPRVGDFYIFPSHVFHGVYPFYTKGERRSFSMNMNFIETAKNGPTG